MPPPCFSVASMAACTGTVSLEVPSPLAPKDLTLWNGSDEEVRSIQKNNSQRAHRSVSSLFILTRFMGRWRQSRVLKDSLNVMGSIFKDNHVCPNPGVRFPEVSNCFTGSGLR